MDRFKNILVYVGTQQNETAVCRALTLAIENDARLTLMDVVKPVPRVIGMMTEVAEPKALENLVLKERIEQLTQMASEYSDTGVKMDVIVGIGDPASEIVRRAIRNEHDLVVKTADGLSAGGRLFGGIAKSLLRNCPCPVWVLKPEIHGEFDRVLAAIDVQSEDQQHVELNREILEIALAISQREHAELHVVSAWDLWMEAALRRRAGNAEVDKILSQQQARVQRSLDELMQAPCSHAEQIKLHLHRGPAAPVIREVADAIEADLMVMGTICRTGVPGFLIGNTAETLLSELTCSVLALKPSGFVSPIDATDVHSPLNDDKATLV